MELRLIWAAVRAIGIAGFFYDALIERHAIAKAASQSSEIRGIWLSVP
jgi:hypothetical protein